MVGPLTPKPGESSADFKLRIEQAQKEMSASRNAAPPAAPAPEPAAPPPASVPAPQPEAKTTPPPAASVPPAQPPATPAQPVARATPTPPASKPEDKVDPLEWARNKGLKTPEDIARSLRSLETEFHRRNQMPPAQPAPNAPSSYPEQPRPSAPYVPPMPPPYQPPAAGGYPPPYQPAPRYVPQPAPLPKRDIQWIADTYQIPVEDAERLAPMVMDMVAVAQRQSDQRFSRLERDNARNSEMFRLMQDPSFQHPEVQFELHRILEEDPRIFDVEPAPYTVAFNRALVNIARKYVMPGTKSDSAPEAPPISQRPPTTLGGDGGASGKAPAEAPLNPAAFNQLPLDKKREVLTAIGARQG
jgi:hypothetical protein